MPRVVVVGASFAGLYAAKGLRRVADVVLIDASDEWEYTPGVHEVLGGRRKAATILASLSDALPGVEFIKGVAVAVNESEVHVETNGSIKKLPYDHLIISVGCAYAQPIKAALASSNRREQLAGAQSLYRDASSVLVVGGGAVGVEVAGELAAHHTVTLAARESELVRDLPEAARRYALEALRSKNVRVELSKCDEERGAFDASIKCYGARPRTGWLATFVDRDARGFVRVDDHYRTSMKNVWAAGDCVAKDADQYLAAYAHFEGEYVALMVASDILGKTPPGAYVPPPRIVALALGPDDGVLCYGRFVVLSGRAVPWVKALVERWAVRLWPLPYEFFRRLPALA